MLAVARDALPPLARAFLGHVTRTRDPYLVPVLLLRGEVDREIDDIADRLFEEVERVLGAAVDEGDLALAPGAETVAFSYDTRLVLPAMLTLGRVHELAGDVPLLRRRPGASPDEALVERGRATTHEVVRALLDGDMRDAINDEEYADFETTVRPREAAARRAQATLEAGVRAWFGRPDTPAAVRDAYERAVEISEGHQARDRDFRELLRRYRAAVDRDGAGAPAGAADGAPAESEALAEAIRDRYRHADPAVELSLFDAERDLPYFATQYERVGVLYEGMLEMYEADLGIELGDSFKRAIVLMVVAAQVGLDDTDDYPEDRGRQLTPVTAELNLRGPVEGVAALRDLVETYLDRAAGHSEGHLTALAIAYIREDARDRLARLESQAT